jgi:hypothetical protein
LVFDFLACGINVVAKSLATCPSDLPRVTPDTMAAEGVDIAKQLSPWYGVLS